MFENNKVIITDRMDFPNYGWMIVQKFGKFNEVEIHVMDAHKPRAEMIINTLENIGILVHKREQKDLQQHKRLCNKCLSILEKNKFYRKNFEKIGQCQICGKKIPKETYKITSNIITLRLLPVLYK